MWKPLPINGVVPCQHILFTSKRILLVYGMANMFYILPGGSALWMLTLGNLSVPLCQQIIMLLGISGHLPENDSQKYYE